MESQRGLKCINKANQKQHRIHEKKYSLYRFFKKHERSHIERILKHMKKYKDNSPMAKNALERYQSLMKR